MVRRWCEKTEPFSQVIRQEIEAVQDFEEEHLVSSAASQFVQAALERQGEELQVSQLRISFVFRLRAKRLEGTGLRGRRRTNVRIQMCALAHDKVLITDFPGSGAPCVPEYRECHCYSDRAGLCDRRRGPGARRRRTPPALPAGSVCRDPEPLPPPQSCPSRLRSPKPLWSTTRNRRARRRPVS